MYVCVCAICAYNAFITRVYYTLLLLPVDDVFIIFCGILFRFFTFAVLIIIRKRVHCVYATCAALGQQSICLYCCCCLCPCPCHCPCPCLSARLHCLPTGCTFNPFRGMTTFAFVCRFSLWLCAVFFAQGAARLANAMPTRIGRGWVQVATVADDVCCQ